MAALTLGNMKTRAFVRLNKASTTSYQGVTLDTIVGEELLAAIRFYEGEPLWFLEANSTTPTLESGEYTEALPDDFESPIDLRMRIDATTWMGRDDNFLPSTIEDVRNRRQNSDTGTPTRWAIYSGFLHFDRVADTDYPLDMDYYKGDATLPGADSVASVFFDDAQEMVLERALESVYRGILHDSDLADVHKGKAEAWELKFRKRHNRRNVPPAALR